MTVAFIQIKPPRETGAAFLIASLTGGVLIGFFVMIAIRSWRRFGLCLGFASFALASPVSCEKAPPTPDVEAAEMLMEKGKWKEAGSAYRELAKQFPQADSLDRFVFFQGLAAFQDADFKQAIPQFERVLKDFPNSPLAEKACYFVAMSHFLSNNSKETLASAARYLEKFPDGHYVGDMRYRLSFIDFNDKDVDRSDKIIRDLSAFLAEHPDDPANGSMLCLLADTYKKKKAASDAETKANEDKAIENYTKAVWTDSPDDVIQYALDSVTNLLKARKDWGAVGDLHGAFLKRKPKSQLALSSVVQLAKNKARDGKREEALDMLAESLKTHIADPANEQVEFLIDELVKALVPRRKISEINPDELDQQLVGILDKIIAGQKNATTAARVAYARARLAQMLKRKDRADLLLKDLALANAKDPAALSPRALETSGDILLKAGELDGAEAMFKRLRDHFPKSTFGDAGPVGLGYVALARNQPEDALGIFEEAVKKPGNTRFQEASLGKLQALVDLDQLEPAEKLAEEILNGGKQFRGQTAAKACLLLARIYRKQAAKAEGEKARELLKKAHDLYMRVFIIYRGYPEINAEGIWEASEIARELGDEELRQKNLKDLLHDPKLEGTESYKKAAKEEK